MQVINCSGFILVLWDWGLVLLALGKLATTQEVGKMSHHNPKCQNREIAHNEKNTHAKNLRIFGQIFLKLALICFSISCLSLVQSEVGLCKLHFKLLVWIPWKVSPFHP